MVRLVSRERHRTVSGYTVSPAQGASTRVRLPRGVHIFFCTRMTTTIEQTSGLGTLCLMLEADDPDMVCDFFPDIIADNKLRKTLTNGQLLYAAVRLGAIEVVRNILNRGAGYIPCNTSKWQRDHAHSMAVTHRQYHIATLIHHFDLSHLVMRTFMLAQFPTPLKRKEEDTPPVERSFFHHTYFDHNMLGIIRAFL